MSVRRKIQNMLLAAAVLLTVLFHWSAAFASTTDGTISATNKYAWGENIGWLNLGTSEGNIHLTNTGMTGYIWGENIGWISLNCSNTSSCSTVDYKVQNDSGGNLTGYGWGENVGWIDFAPTTAAGVSVNASGTFSGYAWGENIGWIVFNCETTNSCATVNYKITTDWRPVCANGLDDDGDTFTDWPDDPGCNFASDATEGSDVRSAGGGTSGSIVPISEHSPRAPALGFAVVIDDDAAETDRREVILTLRGGTDTVFVKISEDFNFSENYRAPYDGRLTNIFAPYTLSEDAGTKIVYVQFCTVYERCSSIVSDAIEYAPKKTILKKIKEAVESILSPIFRQPPSEKGPPPLPPVEELVPKEAPLAFKGEWNLISGNGFKYVATAPLPREFTLLANKFPQLAGLFAKLNITKLADLKRLQQVTLALPGFAERAGIPERGFAVSRLSEEIKKEIPENFTFARLSGGLLDVPIALSVTEAGKPRENIRTVSGSPMQLIIKPDKPAERVRGFVVFKKKRVAEHEGKTRQLGLLRPFLGSLIFANPIFAEEYDPKTIETEFVLAEFEYTDPDHDGVYTADIQAPLVSGEYEIITVITYKDSEEGTKRIRLVAVIDPEGYVYEKVRGKELRIPDAVVTLYTIGRDGTKEEWNAKSFLQENPIVTTKTGAYSFLAPAGLYGLVVTAPGYHSYEGKPFTLKEGDGVHLNIELQRTGFWTSIKNAFSALWRKATEIGRRKESAIGKPNPPVTAKANRPAAVKTARIQVFGITSAEARMVTGIAGLLHAGGGAFAERSGRMIGAVVSTLGARAEDTGRKIGKFRVYLSVILESATDATRAVADGTGKKVGEYRAYLSATIDLLLNDFREWNFQILGVFMMGA